MRKVAAGVTALCFVGLQSVSAEAVITAQNRSTESDVVLGTVVREIRAIPQDTVNLVGDAVKFVTDEVDATKTVIKNALKVHPSEALKDPAMLEVANAWYSVNDVIFRSYSVSESVGNELAQGAAGDVIDVSGTFPGMDFPQGTSVYYRPEFKKLFVRQTLENVLTIEDFLAEHHNATRELMGKQVEIETKFIEINQNTLNELGFDWWFEGKGGSGANLFDDLFFKEQQGLFNNKNIAALRTASTALGAGNAGTLTMIKDAGSFLWSAQIRAMEQADDADILSAPKIVTRDGKTATIQVGDERMIPKRFGVNSANTSIYVENSDWEAMVMGVTLEVTPELRAGNLIDLELKPTILDMLGYDNYQISPDNAALWAVQGNALLNSMMPGRYPVITGSINSAGVFVKNQVGNLYDAITRSVTYQGSSVAGMSAADLDINDWSVHQNQGLTFNTSNGKGGTNNMGAANSNQGFHDQRRMFDREELIQVPSLHGYLPYFRIREMSTQVTVEDGNTVGMGGLVYDKLETFKDRVPVLGSIPWVGRLFRSEGERSIKRNLMIFVTATQVDVHGRRAVDLAMQK